MSTSNALNQSPPSDIAAARAVAHAADHRSHQHHQSIGASWAAIFAGAAAAAALSLILLFLGVGLGLSSVSPWAQDGISVATFGVTTIVWITITQLFASGMGGYLAGRLSTKWVSIHTDEVFFRDTANGFLAWAVASLATAMMLSSAIGGIVGGGVRMGVTVAAASATSAVTTATAAGGAVLGMATQPNNVGDTSGAMSYFLDSMFRRDMTAALAATQAPTTGSTTGATTTAPPVLSSMGNTMRNYSATTNATSNGTANAVQSTNEVASIFANSLRTGALNANDTRYVAQIVAQRAGIPPADAEKRVIDAYERVRSAIATAETTAKEAADKARKASAYAAIWLFISLLSGAFVASFSATLGGRQRDN